MTTAAEAMIEAAVNRYLEIITASKTERAVAEDEDGFVYWELVGNFCELFPTTNYEAPCIERQLHEWADIVKLECARRAGVEVRS